MQCEVVDTKLKKVGSVDLEDAIFDTKEKSYLWHEVVRWQLATKRQGSAKTKQRQEIAGSTKKIYRQKGTGRARHGSRKAPIFRGGGQVFGPKPRDFGYNLPTRVRKQAVRSALSMKRKNESLRVVDKLELEAIKTKAALTALEKFAFKSALIIDEDNPKLSRSVRNLKNFKFVKPEGLNIYDLMKFQGLVVTQAALAKIQSRLVEK